MAGLRPGFDWVQRSGAQAAADGSPQGGEGVFGEDCVEAVGREQLALPVRDVGLVQPSDAADQEPGGGPVLLRLAGERGALGLGDLRVGDSALRALVSDRLRVLDRCPGVLGDRGDQLADY